MGADLLLAALAVVVGLLIGTVGVGGVLMIAFLALPGGLGIHQASATALVSFLFVGALATWLFQRRGSIDWRITLPVCAGAAVFGFAGAFVAARIDPQPLSIAIALIIVVAGVYTFVPSRGSIAHREGKTASETLMLVGVGAASGFGSGFAGAGGPVFAVPVLVILRYVPLTAVAASQVLQIVAALSGSIENLRQGFVDWRVATIITVFELVGVAAGVRLAHRAPPRVLRMLAGLLCAASGGLLLSRSF